MAVELGILFAFGVVFIITLIVLAIKFPKPTVFQYTVFRIVLALAAAGIAALIPGFLQVDINGWLRAGGALAVFVVVYFKSPAVMISKGLPQKSNNKPSNMFDNESTSPVSQSQLEAIDNGLKIDDVVQVLSNDQRCTFDIVVRNTGRNVVNITDVYLFFNEPEERLSGIGLMSVQMVEGVYLITVNRNSAKSAGPTGQFQAQAWYANGGSNLRVGAPIAQSVAIGAVDRFRVAVEFTENTILREPLVRMSVMLQYNGNYQVNSKTIQLKSSPCPTS